MTLEMVMAWSAVTAYAVTAILFVIGVVFVKASLTRCAIVLTIVGAAPHAGAIIARWVGVGHGPYLGFHEVASLLAFLSVLAFIGLVAKYRGFALAGPAVMPVAFLMLGLAMLVSKDAEELTVTLTSYWLVIHVIFANLAYGAYLASFALGAAYLLQRRGSVGRFSRIIERLPEEDIVDTLAFRFVAAGFILEGAMIASGAIWANEAWGRYWAWDPMETWSLIAWLVYAAYLHLRLTMGWKGERAAWLAVAALPVIVFSLLGVPVAFRSIHGAYLSR